MIRTSSFAVVVAGTPAGSHPHEVGRRERSTVAGSATKGPRVWPRCRLLITLSGWSLLAIAATGCKSGATPSVYCRAGASTKIGSEVAQGLNPLLTQTMASCFDSARACERNADPGAPGACEGIAPRWHCYTITANPGDPLNGSAICLPSRETCLASRPRLEGAVISDCAPADAAYCWREESGGLGCSATERECRLSLEMLQALPALKSTGPCTAWPSAR